MSRAQREKGVRGEREVAAIFRRYGFDCERVPNSGGLRFKGDLYGELPAHVEVKRQELWRWEWLVQAEREAPDGALPVVAFRRDGWPWYAALSLAELVFLFGQNRELWGVIAELREQRDELAG